MLHCPLCGCPADHHAGGLCLNTLECGCRGALHLGVSGSRTGATLYQLAQARQALQMYSNALSLHHGDCLGFDTQMHALARACGIPPHVHPAVEDTWRAHCPGGVRYRPLAYRARNEAIVRACTLLIAAPRTLDATARSGTWMTIRYARQRGTPVLLLAPTSEEEPDALLSL